MIYEKRHNFFDGFPFQVPDEERLEHRVHKIEDNLCAKEPYLAQLLNIDPIGADYLSRDQENQIRLESICRHFPSSVVSFC